MRLIFSTTNLSAAVLCLLLLVLVSGCGKSNKTADKQESDKSNEPQENGPSSQVANDSPKNEPGNSGLERLGEPVELQGYSLLGHPLYSKAPTKKALSGYARAYREAQANPRDPSNTIWLGRFEAYCGKYNRAIATYTSGIKTHPDDPRLLRHRGHRYISIRKLDLAIADLEKAAKLIEGTADQVEPDGMPNAKNIPVSSLHTNIWYHLGLAYFCNNEFEKAAAAYEKGLSACQNDDMLVAFTHWAYMTYRQLGDKEAAAKVLEPIKDEMNVIESFDYHKLCLLYKKLKTVDEIVAAETPESNGSSEALQFGIANWYLSETEDEDKASKMLEKLCRSESWAAFGCIAAESTYKRVFGVLSK